MKYKSCAILLLRIAVGVVFVYHGWDKIQNMADYQGFFNTIGLGSWLAFVAYVELLAGVALIIGFNTRIAAMLGLIVMLVAIMKVHWMHGFNSMQGGYEYAFVLCLNFIALMILGSGRHSTDAMYGTCLLSKMGYCKKDGTCEVDHNSKKCDCC